MAHNLKRSKKSEQLKTLKKWKTIVSFSSEPENLQMHNDFPIIGQKVTIQKGENVYLMKQISNFR